MHYDPVFQTDDERNPDYWREVAFMEFVADLDEAMEAHGMKRKWLADRLGKSRSYVTQALRGDDDANMTILSMVKFAMVIGRIVHIHLAPPDSATTWTDRPRRDRIASQEGEFAIPDSGTAQYAVDRKISGGRSLAVAPWRRPVAA
jgi:ParB-like chromosome segregation protein Spo0J